MGLRPMATRGAAAALAVLLAIWPAPRPATGQGTLEDVVARGFDVAVTITPVDLSVEVVGGELRFLTRGTLRGRARIDLEVTAPTPVTQVRMELNAQLTIRSVQAEGTQVTFERSGSQVTLTFARALAPGARIPVTMEYDRQPLHVRRHRQASNWFWGT